MDSDWRPPKLARASAIVGLIVMPIMGVALATARPHGSGGPARPATIPLAFAAFIAARFAFYVRILLRRDDLVIVNAFSRKTIPLADIKEAKPGYMGLTFALRSGGSVTATVGQVSNAARLSGRRGIGGEITDAVIQARGSASIHRA
jgi:hypothetical protein